MPFNYEPCGNTAFIIAFKSVLQFEGGLTHDQADSGGWTNYGICQLDIDPDTNQLFTESGIKELSTDKAKNIYKTKYWDQMNCSKMPYFTAREVFDWGVNAGVGRAIHDLQYLISSSQNDGLIGPKTLNDLKYFICKYSDKFLAEKYAKHRDATYRKWGVGSQSVFLQGWLNRNNSLARELGLSIEV